MDNFSLISLILFDIAAGIPLHMFYPYGLSTGDTRLPRNDDGSSSEINISTAFPFFGHRHRSLFVNTNGDITFLSALSTYSPQAFPYQQNTKIIATYWGDVDTNNGGDIWYRETHDPVLLRQASTEIQHVFPEQSRFNATWVFITTWSSVAFYGADENGKLRRCTFQCVLVTNGIHSFVMFNYYKMQWTTGHSNGGDTSTGLGGTPAQVGFDAGDGEHYYAVNGSRTSDIINIPQKSNIGVAGKFIFRVDLSSVEQATMVNECDNQICQNEGTCEDLDGLLRWRCNCIPGYTGVHCETEIDECASMPCHHNGNCSDLLNAYRCHCREGFTGNSCQIDIDECVSNPCMHGATCRDKANSYLCDCQPGYIGDICEIDIDECQSNPCYNNASCIDNTPGWDCTCLPGFTGNRCQIDINECVSNPCMHGSTCRDKANYYVCDCQPGYIGDNCQIDINECQSNPCYNNASCIDKTPGWDCACLPGYTGNRCQTDINECASTPCHHNGKCLDLINAYRCHCRQGFAGKSCQIDINECGSNPCMHGATCRDKANSYVCNCQPGYIGDKCQIDIDECQSNPCYNNASCIDKTPGWDCACLSGYTGNRCQTEIDECQSNPCRSNGTCVDLPDGYQCICSNESFGQHCEKWINRCSSSPCLHNGMCTNQYGGFTCKCLESWHGERCEFKEINKTQLCTDLEYTECSCFTHQLKPKPKSNKLLIGSIGSIIGLCMTIICYTTWMLLNATNNKGNRIVPEKTEILNNDQSINIENMLRDKDKSKTPVSSARKNGKCQKKHHNCFTDHSGFDFSKLYFNKDGSRRIIKCRHQRDS